eukprot:5046041-Amphidinium_carterae.1
MSAPTSGRTLCGWSCDLRVVSVAMTAPQGMKKCARFFPDDAQGSTDSLSLSCHIECSSTACSNSD